MVARARRIPLKRQKRKQPTPKRWEGTILDLQPVGNGTSGMVFIIDDFRVIKAAFGSPESKRDIATERKAYSIIGNAVKLSPHVLQCLDLDDTRGIVLERCKETVRHRLRSLPQDATVCEVLCRRWAKQAAEGLEFIHNHGILQGDVGCHNMLIDSANVLKLCDFAGSSVAGSAVVVDYEAWSRLPSIAGPSKKSDLFALGSAMYEMSTKDPPYCEMPDYEIQKLYRKRQFQSLEKVGSLADIITKCWSQDYTTANEIVYEIDPHMSLCCGVEAVTLREVESLPKIAAGSPSKSTGSSTWSSSSTTTSETPERTSITSMNTSSPVSSALGSARPSKKPQAKWSLGRLPIISKSTYNHIQVHFMKHKDKHKKSSGLLKSKESKKPPLSKGVAPKSP